MWLSPCLHGVLPDSSFPHLNCQPCCHNTQSKTRFSPLSFTAWARPTASCWHCCELLRALPASAPWSGPSTVLGLPQGHRPESPTSLPKPCALAVSQPGIVSTADPTLCPHPPPLHMNRDPSPLMPQAPSLPSCTPAGTSFSGSLGSAPNHTSIPSLTVQSAPTHASA